MGFSYKPNNGGIINPNYKPPSCESGINRQTEIGNIDINAYAVTDRERLAEEIARKISDDLNPFEFVGALDFNGGYYRYTRKRGVK